MITLDLNLDEFNKRVKYIGGDVLNKTIVRSLNRTLDGMQSQTNKIVRGTVKLKLADVKLAQKKYRAYLASDYARLNLTNVPVPLFKYLSSASKKGIRVNIKGTRKIVKKGFIATMPNGHVGIFKRVGTKRLPIEELFATSVRDVFKSDEIIADVLETARQRYEKEFSSNLKFYLAR